jgi:hypothetical protein
MTVITIALRLEAKGQFPSEEYQMKKPVSLYGDAE